MSSEHQLCDGSVWSGGTNSCKRNQKEAELLRGGSDGHQSMGSGLGEQRTRTKKGAKQSLDSVKRKKEGGVIK